MTNDETRHSITQSLRGIIKLPKDFDYKSELERAIAEVEAGKVTKVSSLDELIKAMD